ncbi:hypothetical protein [Methyloversatilis sp.]|nr:hypothetical protein [Methyloversatilis sp.]
MPNVRRALPIFLPSARLFNPESAAAIRSKIAFRAAWMSRGIDDDHR